MKSVLVLLATLLSFSAFASEKFTPGPDNKATAEGVATVSVGWIKDKGKKYDLNLNMHNQATDKGIIIFLSDMGCWRGNQVGILKYTFFNTGERTIDFKPGQAKNFNMVCNLNGKTKGEFKITVAKVYDNPSLDGKTVGKVIAKDMVWKQDDRNE